MTVTGPLGTALAEAQKEFDQVYSQIKSPLVDTLLNADRRVRGLHAALSAMPQVPDNPLASRKPTEKTGGKNKRGENKETVYAVLTKNSGLNPVDIIRETGLPTTSVHKALGQLEKQGRAEKKNDKWHAKAGKNVFSK